MSTHKYHGIKKSKAKEMLKHGMVRGKKLSKKQKGLFGLISSRRKPTKVG